MIIEIHMKSGKTLKQRGVKDFSFKYNNDQITTLRIELYWWSNFSIFINSIDLASIEAITKR